MAWIYTYDRNGRLIEAEQSFSDRLVVKEPQKPRKGNKLKLSESQERHRKPTHRSGKVVSYRITLQKEVA